MKAGVACRYARHPDELACDPIDPGDDLPDRAGQRERTIEMTGTRSSGGTAEALALANWFDALPIPAEPTPNYSSVPHGLVITITRKHREMIVAALRTPALPSGQADVLVELRKLAVKQHVRMAYGGTFINNGKSCAVCKGEWADDAPEHHAATCPLATSPTQIAGEVRVADRLLQIAENIGGPHAPELRGLAASLSPQAPAGAPSDKQFDADLRDDAPSAQS